MANMRNRVTLACLATGMGVIFTVAARSEQSSGEQPGRAQTTSGTIYSDIEYSHPGGYILRMDAHVPAGKGPFPAGVIVHGGAWVTGDRKHSVAPLFEPISDAGFAWFSISYRLANVIDPRSIASAAASAALVGGAVDDVRQAVTFVKAHASEYHVDPNRIVLIGESAGAQLAAMAALKPDREGAVQGVVGFYCPSNLPELIQTMPFIPDSIRRVVNGTPFEDLLLAHLRELSPVTWVRADSPPFLLIHGTVDNVVPFRQSVEMCEAMHKAGASCELFPVRGASHGLRFWEANRNLLTYKVFLTDWLKRISGESDRARL